MESKLENEITDLTAKWYEYVGKNHHKDGDCHFYICREWQYGNQPLWKIGHYGYVGHQWEQTAPSYAKALKIMKRQIKLMIERQENWVKDVEALPKSYDSDQINQAKAFRKLFPTKKATTT